VQQIISIEEGIHVTTSPRDYRWNEFFCRHANEHVNDIEITPNIAESSQRTNYIKAYLTSWNSL